MNISTQQRTIEIISSLFILLFVYTAASKFITHDQFEKTISISPLVGFAASILSWTIPVIEFFVAVLLLVPRFRSSGMVAALILMALFTAYVFYILLFSSHLPCSCGGVIEQMSWTQHALFNLFFTILAALGVWLTRTTKLFIAINRNSRTPV